MLKSKVLKMTNLIGTKHPNDTKTFFYSESRKVDDIPLLLASVKNEKLKDGCNTFTYEILYPYLRIDELLELQEKILDEFNKSLTVLHARCKVRLLKALSISRPYFGENPKMYDRGDEIDVIFKDGKIFVNQDGWSPGYYGFMVPDSNYFEILTQYATV